MIVGIVFEGIGIDNSFVVLGIRALKVGAGILGASHHVFAHALDRDYDR